MNLVTENFSHFVTKYGFSILLDYIVNIQNTIHVYHNPMNES
jgi:hypothetical protein